MLEEPKAVPQGCCLHSRPLHLCSCQDPSPQVRFSSKAPTDALDSVFHDCAHGVHTGWRGSRCRQCVVWGPDPLPEVQKDRSMTSFPWPGLTPSGRPPATEKQSPSFCPRVRDGSDLTPRSPPGWLETPCWGWCKTPSESPRPWRPVTV